MLNNQQQIEKIIIINIIIISAGLITFVDHVILTNYLLRISFNPVQTFCTNMVTMSVNIRTYPVYTQSAYNYRTAYSMLCVCQHTVYHVYTICI